MIQVYTGNGKGKTTAALGLAIRAAGAGLKVYIAQFAKGRVYSEFKSLSKIKNIKFEQFGRRCFIYRRPSEKDILLAKKGMAKVRKIVFSGRYAMVVLDEINCALKMKLIGLNDLMELIKNTPAKTELVFTGRWAPKKLIRRADLVSSIKEVKHYYKKGIQARRGIEF